MNNKSTQPGFIPSTFASPDPSAVLSSATESAFARTSARTLVAIPVYNEEKYVERVLSRVLSAHPNVLVIDDGSSDRTASLLSSFAVDGIRHAKNAGYGQSLNDAFAYAMARDYEWIITIDCDEQHEPAAIPAFIERASRGDADIISGSRYLLPPSGDSAPADRRAINASVTAELNQRLSTRLGTTLTDSFCGFKAHRVSSLRSLRITDKGYAFPMQLWVQAAAYGLRVCELPVKLIYNDTTRTFGGLLDDAQVRLKHYRQVMHQQIRQLSHLLPNKAAHGLIDAVVSSGGVVTPSISRPNVMCRCEIPGA